MAYEATGTVKRIDPTMQVSEKFQKREFVVSIADNPKYPQLVQFQATGDRCSQLDRVGVGDEVLVEFSLRGREWKKPGTSEVKFFNSLDAWRVEVKQPAAGSPSAPVPAGPEDDLPFAVCSIDAEPSPIAPALRRNA